MQAWRQNFSSNKPQKFLPCLISGFGQNTKGPNVKCRRTEEDFGLPLLLIWAVPLELVRWCSYSWFSLLCVWPSSRSLCHLLLLCVNVHIVIALQMLKGKFTLSLPLRSQPTTTTSCAWPSPWETGLYWSPSGWSTTSPSVTTSFTYGQLSIRRWCGGKISPSAGNAGKSALCTHRYSHLPLWEMTLPKVLPDLCCASLLIAYAVFEKSLLLFHPFCPGWNACGVCSNGTRTNCHLGDFVACEMLIAVITVQGCYSLCLN